ncbi:hypothetical protein [Candidatus Finniella inopinata]|uniref:Uncharacterized protein n=1 Tax=Candidatus Finniella inopinata TaxID=1696036 RepID=A0A4Q7DIP7_9PROT|nr:hypothetical protein [Candidatus Finniella inopinata]RZI46178.1 hypothetical protein EQU50_04380 [Candidatus Finniella inopinata]
MGDMAHVTDATQKQQLSPQWGQNFSAEANNRAIMTSLGFIPDQYDTTKTKVVPMAGFLAQSVRDAQLTRAIDSMIDSVFSYQALAYAALQVAPHVNATNPTGALPAPITIYSNGTGNGPSNTNPSEYALKTGSNYSIFLNQAGMFGPDEDDDVVTTPVSLNPDSSNAATASMKSPAQKVGMLLRCIFGIDSDTFNKKLNLSPLDMEDSGKVVTAIFDRVLGENRTGTGATLASRLAGIPVNCTNAWSASLTNGGNKAFGSGGNGIFNVGAGGGNILNFGNSGTTPSAYFDWWFSRNLGSNQAGITMTSARDASYDIQRLKLLLNSVVQPVTYSSGAQVVPINPIVAPNALNASGPGASSTASAAASTTSAADTIASGAATTAATAAN